MTEPLKPRIDFDGRLEVDQKDVYKRQEVNEMQIIKQADVVMLNYMLPEQFSAASCLANLQFYRCV